MTDRIDWDKWKPSATVVATFMAGVIVWWVSLVMWMVYDVQLNAIDVSVNQLWFVTLVAWWTDYNRRS